MSHAFVTMGCRVISTVLAAAGTGMTGGGAYLAAKDGNAVSETTMVPLGFMVMGMLGVASIVWWAAKLVQKVLDDQRDIKRRLEELEEENCPERRKSRK
jgi:hypothetical protein